MGVEALAIGALTAFGAAGSYAGAVKSSESNERINKQNVDLQNRINSQNEGLMRESWKRDEGAVSRRAADLEAAGLSKTLAAGSAAAASSPIKLDAPQKQFEDSHWAGAGADMGKQIGASAYMARQADSAAAQADLTRSQIQTEVSKRKQMDANAVNQLATAGFKGQAERVMHKDADLWVNQNLDVRDRDLLSKGMRAFPEVTEKVRRTLKDPGRAAQDYANDSVSKFDKRRYK